MAADAAAGLGTVVGEPGAALAVVITGGAWGTCVVTAAELSNGGSTDSVVDGGKDVGIGVEVGADVEIDTGDPAALDAAVGDPGDAEGACDGCAANSGTDIPGGGAATASGSSISSNGRSGNCSSKGETGTPANPFGTLGLADAPVADGAGAVLVDVEVVCNPGVVPPAAPSLCVRTKSIDELAAEFDAPAAAAPEPPFANPAAEDPAAAELALFNPAVTEPGPAEAELEVPERPLTELALPVPVRAVLAEPITDDFPAGEVVPVATPIGRVAFFEPVVAASPDDVAPYEAAPAVPDTLEEGAAAPPIRTPTGLEAAAGAARLDPACVVEDAVALDLFAPALAAAVDMAPALAPEPVPDVEPVLDADPVLDTEPTRAAPAPAAAAPRVPAVGEADPALAAEPSTPPWVTSGAEAPAFAEAAPARALAPARAAPAGALAPVGAAPACALPAPAEPPLRAVALGPLVPSTRTGAPGSDTPNNTSGSSNSDGAISVGTSAESGRASGITDPANDPDDPDADDTADASGSKSSNAPCESKSSSESSEPFAVEGAAGAEVDGAGAVEAVRPGGVPVPANPMGSSTGRSAKGSKAGREAASIVFEPESRRSIQNVSCNAAAELPRRWLTERRGRPYVVTQVTLSRFHLAIFILRKSDGQSSILPLDQVQSGQSGSVPCANPNPRAPAFESE